MYLLGQVEALAVVVADAPALALLAYTVGDRESVASSAIEGSHTTRDELLRHEAIGRSSDPVALEVANYVAALDWGAREITGAARDRVYVCTPLLDAALGDD